MSKKLTNEEFKDRVRKVHPELQILEEYVDARTKILVKDKYGICKIAPDGLLKHIPSILSAVNKTDYWAEMAKEVHGNKYNYSKVDYKTNQTKVEIICSIHGSFWQTPGNHSQFGCEKCSRKIAHGKGIYSIVMAERNKENWKNIPATVYNIELSNKNETFNKIGISTLKLNRRFSTMTKYKYKVLEELNVSLYEAIYLENAAHDYLREYSYKPKHKFAGYKECFIIEGHTPQDVLNRLQAL